MSEIIEKSKDKYMGVIILIIAAVAFIVIFEPFGSKIEGEWAYVSAAIDGHFKDFTFNPTSIIFYEDGTAQKIYYNGSSSTTMHYSYSKGRLAIDGEIYDCKIDGDIMKLSMNEDGHEAQIILRRK